MSTLIERARNRLRLDPQSVSEDLAHGRHVIDPGDAVRLARFAVAAAEAMPGLYVGESMRENDDGSWETTARVDIDAHNATLDRLAAMLEGT